MDKKERENDIGDEFEPTEETHADEPELEDVEEYSDRKLKKLRDKLKECEAEKMRHLEDLQRTKADFLNSKRRLEEQLERDRIRIKNQYIETLLPLCDSFDMAMGDQSWSECDPKWREGIERIHAQLSSILRTHNVEPFGEVGDAFDPLMHEAVSNAPGATENDIDTVVSVLQKGYRLNGAIIRPAKVTVGVQ